MAILLFGIWQFVKIFPQKISKILLLTLAAMIIIFNNSSLFFVSASYYDLSNLEIFINQASQYKPAVFKGNIMVVIFSTTVLAQILLIFHLIKKMLAVKYKDFE